MVDKINGSNSVGSKYNSAAKKSEYIKPKSAYTIWKLQQLEKAQAKNVDSTKSKTEITGHDILKNIQRVDTKKGDSIFSANTRKRAI